MATQAIEQISDAPAPTKSRRGIFLLALGGILAGGAAGVFALGPVLTKRAAAKPAAVTKDASKTETPVHYEFANLVLNPAGTGGTRFLMLTATFQVKDDATKQLFTDRDSEVRDRILGVLGKRTVDDLAEMSHREVIKQELIDSVGAMFPKGAIVKLSFPQFVIQ
jgi:flagellar protein FliL